MTTNKIEEVRDKKIFDREPYFPVKQKEIALRIQPIGPAASYD